jgi:HEAT repeat protein
MKKLIKIFRVLAFLMVPVAVSAGDFEDLIVRLNSHDTAAQISAVQELAKRRDEKAVEALMTFVFTKAEDWKVKVRAIRLLGEIPSIDVSDKLVTVFNDPFLNDECPAMKWHTAVALGQRFNKGTRAVSTLIEALSYKNLLIQEAAVQSLGKIGDPDAVPYLVAALDDSRFAIKYNAIKALENIGSKEAIPFLQKSAEEEKDAFLRDEIRKTIRNIGSN